MGNDPACRRNGGDGQWTRTGGGPAGLPGAADVFPEQGIALEAGVALAALGVEDPKLGGSPRRAVAVATHRYDRSLADDVPAEADPRSSGELQPEAGGIAHGA